MIPGPPSSRSPSIDRRRWIDAAILLTQTLLALLFLGALWRADAETGSEARRWVAALVALSSLGLGGSALLRLRHSFRPATTPVADGRLERGGPFRHLRHPMYASVLGLVLAGCIFRPDTPVLLLGGLHYLFYWGKSRYEERLLKRRYRDYAEYARRTRGLGP